MRLWKCPVTSRPSLNPTHAMALLFSANSLAMVAPNLTCAASRTHTRRAQPARPVSGPSRHRAAHRWPPACATPAHAHNLRTSRWRTSSPRLVLGRPGGRAVAEKMSGVTAPFGFFDPMGLTPETNEELQLFREAELAHGRVAMVGALGFLVQEQFHPLFADVGGPAIRQLDVILQTPNGLSAGTVMLFGIFFSEWSRAKIGWMEPEVETRL